MRIVAGIPYVLIAYIAVVFIRAPASAESDMAGAIKFVAWMAAGLVVLSFGCAAGLSVYLRRIGLSRRSIAGIVAGGMALAVVTAPIAFEASSAIGTVADPTGSILGFGAAILGTALGA